MTLAELRAAVKTFGYGNEDEAAIDTWLNMAYQDVAGRRKWRWTETFVNTGTVAGFDLTALPAHLFLGDLRSRTAGLITPRYVANTSEVDDLHRRTGLVSGPPQVYTVLGNSLYWYPTPNATYSYRLYTWAAPALLSAAGDTPLVPLNYHQVLIEGALMHAASRDHNPARKQEHEQRFERLIQEMGMKDRQRTTNSDHLYLPDVYGGVYDRRRKY